MEEKAIKAKYTKILKYEIEAEAESALHIGNGMSDEGEVLVDDRTGEPFIQGTSVAGAFLEAADEEQKKCFGNKNEKKDKSKEKNTSNKGKNNDKNDIWGNKSRLTFSDVHFKVNEGLRLEYRTRVRLDAKSGTTDQANNSGQLHNIELISAGSEMTFDIYRFLKPEENEDELVEELLAALDRQEILLGGNVTNGCGKVKLTSVRRSEYDLTTPEGRKDWSDEGKNKGQECLGEIRKIKRKSNKKQPLKFRLEVSYPNAILVKGNYVNEELLEKQLKTEFEEDKNRVPDAMNIVNGREEYIIPATSIKGVFRQRMEAIEEHLAQSCNKEDREKTTICEHIFEGRPEIFFMDSVIKGKVVRQQMRTAINKFTGAVKNNALFSEAIVNGESVIEITLSAGGDGNENNKIDEQKEKAAAALLLFTCRDLAIGAISLGSTSSVGRGFVKVSKLEITHGEEISVIDFETQEQTAENSFITECMENLKEELEYA